MRAQVALVENGLVLLAQHRRTDHDYWVLPGGAVEDGESPEQAAVREMREETGLDISVGRLLFVDEPRQDVGFVIRQPRYTYLGAIVGGMLSCVEDPKSGNPGNGHLCAVQWRPFEAAEYDAGTRDTLRRLKMALELR